MSQIITYHPGPVDPDEVFGGLKEDSEPFTYFCCPRNQIESSGISIALMLGRAQRKTWEREEEHRGGRVQITSTLPQLHELCHCTSALSQLMLGKKHKCQRKTLPVFM